MKKSLFQCAGCNKLFEAWKDVSIVYIDDNRNGYYLCDDCIKSKEIKESIETKDLNSSEVTI